MRTPVLFISGPVGVGKTTIANEVGSCLEKMGIAHTVIDFDNLTDTWPRPTDDPWGDRLGRANLGNVWRNCAAAGAKNLIIAHVVEQRAWVEEVCALIPGAEPALCLLMANDATLANRVRRRELGAGRAWHQWQLFSGPRQRPGEDDE